MPRFQTDRDDNYYQDDFRDADLDLDNNRFKCEYLQVLEVKWFLCEKHERCGPGRRKGRRHQGRQEGLSARMQAQLHGQPGQQLLFSLTNPNS